jgi:Xaa-Pro aminopeptidase
MRSLSTVELIAAAETGWDLGAALPPIERGERLHQLAQAMRTAGPDDTAVDAMIVTDLTNISWLTGFTGSSATVMVLADASALFITDGRYAERAEQELAAQSGITIEIGRSAARQTEILTEAIAALVPQTNQTTVGLEADTISWSKAQGWISAFAPAEVVPTRGAVEGCRRVKSGAEIARTARACAIADAALASIVPLLSTGVTEAEFAAAFDSAVVKLGADDISFDTIIASGPNGSRPHHTPSGRVIEDGDMIICDLGALVDGYHSDMTRTILFGDVSSAQRRHFDVVRQAQAAGVATIVDGAAASDVDSACRAIIADVGWADHFVHGTGHGTGLLIHEAPWINATSTDVLASGELMTVEPGVYLPGVGGVRIEDLCLVTDDGPVVLTRSPYLMAWP